MKPEEVALRRAEWYQRAGIEVVRGVEAVSLLPGKVGDEVVLVFLYLLYLCLPRWEVRWFSPGVIGSPTPVFSLPLAQCPASWGYLVNLWRELKL